MNSDRKMVVEVYTALQLGGRVDKAECPIHGCMRG